MLKGIAMGAWTAVEFDAMMRKCGGMSGDVFVHRSMQPLDEEDFRTDVDKGHGLLFDIDRWWCSGICGV